LIDTCGFVLETPADYRQLETDTWQPNMKPVLSAVEGYEIRNPLAGIVVLLFGNEM
jgi:hypothetical protein